MTLDGGLPGGKGWDKSEVKYQNHIISDFLDHCGAFVLLERTTGERMKD